MRTLVTWSLAKPHDEFDGSDRIDVNSDVWIWWIPRVPESVKLNSDDLITRLVFVEKTKITCMCLWLSVNWCEKEGKPICKPFCVRGIEGEVEGSGEAGNATGFFVPNVDGGGVEGATKRRGFWGAVFVNLIEL